MAMTMITMLLCCHCHRWGGGQVLTFVPSCKENAAATRTAQNNTQKMKGTNGLEMVLMATGNNDQLWEEAATTGRRERPR